MELQKQLARLNELERKLFAYGAAESEFYLDDATTAPKDTAAGRGVARSVLAGETHALLTSPATGDLLDSLDAGKESLDFIRRREVQELRRRRERLTKIPAEEFRAWAELTNAAGGVWREAKEKSDFSLFRPTLEKLVDFTRRRAGYFDSGKAPYDVLLDQYERGLDMEALDSFFAVLRERLLPVIRAVAERPAPEEAFLRRFCPAAEQRKLAEYMMDMLGLDRRHCGLAETEHPFTLTFTNRDVRVTTHYKENNMFASMYTIIHEGGHALYEMGVADELQYTCLSGGACMSIHESQSRFYENCIGRSRPFIGAVFPKLREFYPAILGDVDEEAFYRAVNAVHPSLIRTESDELTNSLHIMVRCELERGLIDGDLAVKDVPGEWNRLYREYLGVEVPDDRRGCLQDSHWSGGSFGYFPSYALGSAYAAQMLRNMEGEMDVWGPAGRGDLAPVTAWLHEKVHRHGALLEPGDVLKNAVGVFDPTVYTDYLTKKYSELYAL